MKQLFVIMALMLSVWACAMGSRQPAKPVVVPAPAIVAPVPAPAPIQTPIPAPLAEAPILKANVTFFGDKATPERIAKYKKAIVIAQKVVATSAFRARVLSFDSPYTVNKFYDTTRSNAQVLSDILNGKETLSSDIDYEIDLEVDFYYEASTTVGYTTPSSKRIHINTKFFDTYTPRSVAANMMHEWCHKLGYKHAQAYSASRDYSVPYAIGSMVRELGKQFE